MKFVEGKKSNLSITFSSVYLIVPPLFSPVYFCIKFSTLSPITDLILSLILNSKDE